MATTPKDTLKVLEIDALSGETTLRDLTVAELKQRELDAIEIAKIKTGIEAKAAARQSALAKLKELGLTEAEIAAL